MGNIEMTSPETLYLNMRINALEKEVIKMAELNTQMAFALLDMQRRIREKDNEKGTVESQGFDAMEALSIFNETEEKKVVNH